MPLYIRQTPVDNKRLSMDPKVTAERVVVIEHKPSGTTTCNTVCLDFKFYVM